MKRAGRLIGALLALVLFMSGCGRKVEENTAQGLQLLEQMEYENALQCFEMALVNGERSRQAFRGQGLAYMGLGDYENAAACLERALDNAGAWPGQLDFDINYYLATAYYKLGQAEQAIAVYRAITDLRPEEKTAWYLKGTIELELGRQEQALEDFNKAVAISKTDYDLRINIYNQCVRCGSTEMGASYLREVLESDAAAGLSDYDMGRICYYLGDYEQARLSLEKAKDKSGADAVSLLGQTYEQLGDYNYAASVYSSYLENRQPDARIYNQLGLCKLRALDYEGALNAFRAGIEIEGNVAMQSLKFNEIIACEYLGQFEQAKILMQQYLALWPDDGAALREAAFLQSR